LIASQIYKWRNDAKTRAVMGIRNEGELHSKIGFNILKKENEELKKAHGESAFHITILKKKVRAGLTTKQKIVTVQLFHGRQVLICKLVILN
jgi:3,4-dihydroxy-2-butanone 4-phosphate synthase